MCINTTLTLAIEYGLERLPPLGTAQHGPCQSPVNRTLHSRTRAQLHDHHVSLSEWGRAGNVNTAYMYKKDCMYIETILQCIVSYVCKLLTTLSSEYITLMSLKVILPPCNSVRQGHNLHTALLQQQTPSKVLSSTGMVGVGQRPPSSTPAKQHVHVSHQYS